MSFFTIVYQIKCGVSQGFPALRKAVTAHVKNHDNCLRVFDIANRLLTRHSPFAPFGQVESFRLSNFLGLWPLKKHGKIRIAYRQRRSKFPKLTFEPALSDTALEG